MAKPVRQLIELLVCAVNDDEPLGARGDVPQKRIEICQAPADLDDEHGQIG
jgi:hypothetical protein